MHIKRATSTPQLKLLLLDMYALYSQLSATLPTRDDRINVEL